MIGIVKFYNETKGYGFIETTEGEVFVHATGLIEKIKQGDRVSFETKNGKIGLNAINVVRG